MPELIGLASSPWTEKARWALDHHRIEYRYRQHVVLFGMPSLHWKTRKFLESPTVPAYIDGKVRLADSFAIARYADDVGKSAKLFPAGSEARISELNNLCERGLDAGRAILLHRMASDRQAQYENLPEPLKSKALTPLALVGIGYLASAFGAKKKSVAEHENELHAVLLLAQNILSRNRWNYALEQFSFGDIALAAIAQLVVPVDDRYIRLGPASRACWENPPLAREFADVVKWRDALYSKHRANSKPV